MKCLVTAVDLTWSLASFKGLGLDSATRNNTFLCVTYIHTRICERAIRLSMRCYQGTSPTLLRHWERVTYILYAEREFRRPMRKWLSQSIMILFLFAWCYVCKHFTTLSYHILKQKIQSMPLVNVLHASWCAEQLRALSGTAVCAPAAAATGLYLSCCKQLLFCLFPLVLS